MFFKDICSVGDTQERSLRCVAYFTVYVLL